MRIKFIVYTIALLFSLVGCSKEEIFLNPGEEPTKGTGEDSPKRTVLVYMVASNLGGSLQNNLHIMTSVATKKNLNGGNLIIYYSENKGKASLFEIKPDEEGVPVRHHLRDYEGQSAVSKETMRSVIDEVVSLYPADSYGMVLSSHATAWMPVGYQNMLRSFGEESGKWMEVDELAKGIPDGLFDFLLFDACSMGAIECVYELKDKADYIIASPSEVLAVGFPYKKILPYLFTEKPDYENIAEDFYTFFQNYTYPVGSISVTVTKELDKLAAITKEIIGRDENVVLSLDMSALQVLSYLPSSPIELVDFGDMVKQLATDSEYQRFENILKKAVLYPYCTEQIYTTKGSYYDVTAYSGLSVYPLRPELTQLNNWYKSRLSWYQTVFE